MSEPNIVWVTKEMDWQHVIDSTGLDYSVNELIELIDDFDQYVENNGLAGYIDASDILSDAFMHSLPPTYSYQDHEVNPSTVCDYFAYIYDLLDSNLDDEDLEQQDIEDYQYSVQNVSDRAHLIFNCFLLGLTHELSEAERAYLSDTYIRREEMTYTVEGYDPYMRPHINVNEHVIVFPISLNKEYQSAGNEEARTHRFYIDALDRRVSDNREWRSVPHQIPRIDNRRAYQEDTRRITDRLSAKLSKIANRYSHPY